LYVIVRASFAQIHHSKQPFIVLARPKSLALARAPAAAAAQADAAAMAADISTDGSSRRLLGSFISARDAQNSQQTMTPAAVGPARNYSPGNIMVLLATSHHAFKQKQRRFNGSRAPNLMTTDR
jgi:hypothetical protein